MFKILNGIDYYSIPLEIWSLHIDIGLSISIFGRENVHSEHLILLYPMFILDSFSLFWRILYVKYCILFCLWHYSVLISYIFIVLCSFLECLDIVLFAIMRYKITGQISWLVWIWGRRSSGFHKITVLILGSNSDFLVLNRL